METFKDELEREAKVSITLGGKVLVLDVELQLDQDNNAIALVAVKTSYALADSPEGSPALDQFLFSLIHAFLDCVQAEQVDFFKVDGLSNAFRSHLRYLMRLDALAALPAEQEGGIRWLTITEDYGRQIDQLVTSEARLVAQ